MRVLVLGGGGRMGFEAVRDLAQSPEVRRVTVADARRERAKARIEARGERERHKIDLKGVDVTERAGLVAMMKETDLVVNCVGPFYRFGLGVVEAALEATVSYVDICDDYDATQAMLAQDERAKEAGVTILTGMGLSPGLTNVLARLGVDRLDRAYEVDTSWVVGVADPAGFGALFHGLHMISGKVPQYLDGQWVEVPALSGSTYVELPEPLGRCEVYYVGHSEPVTIPRFLKGLKRVTNRGGLYPPWANQHSRDRVALGLDRVEPVMVDGRPVVPRDFAIALDRAVIPARRAEGLDLGPPCSGLRVDIRGEKGGKKVRHSYYGVCPMARATGVSASIAALMVGRGDVKAKGVVAPEACLNAEAFVAEYARRGLELYALEERLL
ncbi:MAG: saccharopine dehydrogenase NADP-binding domain-containing protein [Chloroflexota bacterium]|nr:saccharopine dehydrogenase NADP-binding domain-containing protein [Chloroflexota bacterium]